MAHGTGLKSFFFCLFVFILFRFSIGFFSFSRLFGLLVHVSLSSSGLSPLLYLSYILMVLLVLSHCLLSFAFVLLH